MLGYAEISGGIWNTLGRYYGDSESDKGDKQDKALIHVENKGNVISSSLEMRNKLDINVAQGGEVEFTGSLGNYGNNAAEFYKSGAGLLVFSSKAGNHSGSITVAEGTMRMTDGSRVLSGGTFTVNADAVLETQDSVSIAKNLTNNGTITNNGTLDLSGATITLNSAIANNGTLNITHKSALSLNVTGSGIVNITTNGGTRELDLQAASNFTGTLNINNGGQWTAILYDTEERTAPDAVYYDVNTTQTGNNGIVLGSQDKVWHIGNLSGTANVSGQYNKITGAGDGTRTIAVHQTATTTYSGVFQNDGASGTRGISIQKFGAGNLILTAANTSKSDLVINGGTLTLGGANGAWAGAITVNENGTLAYNGADRTLRNDVTWADGSTLRVSPDGETAAKLTLAAADNISLCKIRVDANATFEVNGVLNANGLITNDGTLNINGTLNLADGIAITNNGTLAFGTDSIINLTSLTPTDNVYRIFTNGADATVSGWNSLDASNLVGLAAGWEAAFNNDGTISLSRSSNVLEWTPGENSVWGGDRTFHPEGQEAGVTGTVTEDSIVTFTGDAAVTLGADISIAGLTSSENVTATISGTNAFSAGSITVVNGSTIDLGGVSNLSYNSAEVESGGTFKGAIGNDMTVRMVDGSCYVMTADNSVSGQDDHSVGVIRYEGGVLVLGASITGMPVTSIDMIREDGVLTVDPLGDVTWTTMPATSLYLTHVDGNGTAGSLTLGTRASGTAYYDTITVDGGATLKLTDASQLLASGNTIQTNLALKEGTLMFLGKHSGYSHENEYASACARFTYMFNNLSIAATGAVVIDAEFTGDDASVKGDGFGFLGTFTYTGTGANSTVTVTADLTAWGSSGVTTRTFDISGNGDLAEGAAEVTLAGVIGNYDGTDSRNVTLVKTGTGTLKIADTAKSYTPGLLIREGTVIAASTTSIGAQRSDGIATTLAIGDGETANSAILDLQADNRVAVLSGTSKGHIINNSAEAKTLTIDGAGGTFAGSVGANVNLSKSGSGTMEFTGDLSAFNGDVTSNGGTLNLANSGETAMGIGTLTIGGNAGTTTIGGKTTANTINIASGKTLSIAGGATLTHDKLTYTGLGADGGCIDMGGSSGSLSMFDSTNATVSNVMLAKNVNEFRNIRSQLTNVAFVDEAGGGTQFSHADNTLASMKSVASVIVSGNMDVTGDINMSAGKTITLDNGVTLTNGLFKFESNHTGEGVINSGTGGNLVVNSDYLFSNMTVTLTGDTTDKTFYAGVNGVDLVKDHDSTITVDVSWRGSNNNLDSLYVKQGSIEFATADGRSETINIAGAGNVTLAEGTEISLKHAVQTGWNHPGYNKLVMESGVLTIAANDGADAVISSTGTGDSTLAGADATAKVGNATVVINNTEGDASKELYTWGAQLDGSSLATSGDVKLTNTGTNTVSGLTVNRDTLTLAGKLQSTGNTTVAGTLDVQSSDVTLGNATAKTTLNSGDADAIGTITIADAQTLKVINAEISNIAFATAEGAAKNGTLDISAGEVLSGCVTGPLEGGTPGATTPVNHDLKALMKDCSLSNTDVVIHAKDAIEAAMDDHEHVSYLDKTFTLSLMSGVTGDFTLTLAGMEIYKDINICWLPSGSAAQAQLVSGNGSEPSVIDVTPANMMAYTPGAPVNFSTNGEVVDVWVTYTVPEPATGALSVLALAALAARRRRRGN